MKLGAFLEINITLYFKKEKEYKNKKTLIVQFTFSSELQNLFSTIVILPPLLSPCYSRKLAKELQRYVFAYCFGSHLILLPFSLYNPFDFTPYVLMRVSLIGALVTLFSFSSL